MAQHATTPDDVEPRVRQLAQTILGLMPQWPNGWVPWRQVAKKQEGTEEFAPLFIGLARLPEWKHLFAENGKVVKLTQAGIQFAQHGPVERLPEIQQIADGVKRYASGLAGIKLNVARILKVARIGEKFVHAVCVDLIDLVISSEVPVEFRPRNGSVTRGKVAGQEPDGSILYVSFDNQIWEADLPGILYIDRGFLLHQLSDRIRTLPHLPPLISSILHGRGQGTGSAAGRDSVEVADVLARLSAPWARFLWGPPGAGKTYALGHLASCLLQTEPDERILLVAPSNRAVDVAVEQLIGQLENNGLGWMVSQRKILRFGYPRKTQIVERLELLGPPEFEELNEQARTLSAQLARAEHERSSEADLAILRAKLMGVQEDVKDAVRSHVGFSQIVATTVTLCYLSSSPIPDHEWSTVLVDEATMVSPAMCVFLASLAHRRLLLAGDPQQLGPIYESKSPAPGEDFEWMGRDIFDKSGVSSGAGESRRIFVQDVRLARITSQRRCAPEIWSRVEHLYPEVCNLADGKCIEPLRMLPPCSGHSVALLDTSKSEQFSFCQPVQHSWQNQFTADLAMEVALTIASEASNGISIAIISPYRAQVRLLKRALRQEQRANRTPYHAITLESGTVHQFQGSDADVVIFDIVDGIGRSKTGALLRGDTGIRLTNVAITRAKGKVVVLADKTWCERAFEPKDNPILWELIIGRKAWEQLKVAPPPAFGTENDRKKPESPIEEMLYEAMLKHSDLASVETQVVIRDQEHNPVSRADFAFPDLRYAIYCDGRQWHLREDRWQRDLRQRNKLAELGWIFSVFTGSDIHRNVDECVAQIAATHDMRSQNMKKKRTTESRQRTNQT